MTIAAASDIGGKPHPMRAIEFVGFGGPEVVAECRRPVPSPGEDEILVKVGAAGVNRPDVTQRRGKYPPPPGVTDIPGLDIAGWVARARPGSRFREGDRVCALVAGGGYAEYCVAPEQQCMPLPDGLGIVEAASLPEIFFTAWNNLFEVARLAEGETILVQGGTSGVGLAAIQLAKQLRGARVLVTCSTREKGEVARSFGADHAVDYTPGDWDRAVVELIGERAVDMVLDSQGGHYTQRELDLLADDGRLVLIAAHQGEEATVNVRSILRRRLTLTGSTIRARSPRYKGAIARKLEREVWPLFSSGRMRTLVQKVLPLGEARRAHEWLDANAQIGKLVLLVDETAVSAGGAIESDQGRQGK